MAELDLILRKLDEWVQAGLLSPEQAAEIRIREEERPRPPERRVRVDEILVYLGSLVVFLALAFLVGFNWASLGSVARILTVLLPTLAMLAGGWFLRSADDPRLRRGAQALWLGAVLLGGLTFGVTVYELNLLSEMENIVLGSAVFAVLLAGVLFALLPTLIQSVVLCLSGAFLLFAYNVWLQERHADLYLWAFFAGGLLLGLAGLWFARGLHQRGRADLAVAAQIFGTLVTLWVFFLEMTEQTGAYRTLFVGLMFLLCVGFIAASLWRQSRVYLFGGAAFLLFWIIYLNLEYFADEVGLPLVLLVIGAALIGLGLGTGWINQRIGRSSA